MTRYLNPPGQTKEDWLRKYAELTEPVFPQPEGKSLICLIQNPRFSAAVIVESDRDFQYVTLGDDPRPKTFWQVDSELLVAVSH